MGRWEPCNWYGTHIHLGLGQNTSWYMAAENAIRGTFLFGGIVGPANVTQAQLNYLAKKVGVIP